MFLQFMIPAKTCDTQHQEVPTHCHEDQRVSSPQLSSHWSHCTNTSTQIYDKQLSLKA
jgi:hypothetical protein